MPASRKPRRRARRAAAILAAASWCGAACGAQEGADLLPRLVGRLERDRAALNGYSYLESVFVEKRDGDGALRSHSSSTSEVTFREGHLLRRPAAAGAGATAAGPDPSPPAEEDDGALDIRSLAACVRLYPIGTETIGGAERLRIAFTAVDGCLKGTGRVARILGHLTGDLWLDTEGGEVVRLEGRLQSPVSFGLGLLGRVETFDVELTREPVGPGVYATTHLAYRATGRIFLARPFDRREIRFRSGFAPIDAGRLSALTSTPSPPPPSDPDRRPRDRS